MCFTLGELNLSTFLLPYLDALDAAIQGHLLQKLLAPSPQQAVCA